MTLKFFLTHSSSMSSPEFPLSDPSPLKRAQTSLPSGEIKLSNFKRSNFELSNFSRLRRDQTFKLLTFVCLLFAASLPAQIRYGFKTGLNFASIDGVSEVDASGKLLETWKNTTGFHIGATFSLNFTDNLGVRTEFLYSKKGAKYTFEGPGYRFFTQANGTKILTTGNVRYLVNITNSYIDIPLMAFGRFGDFEISAGPYAALNIQSAGEGSLRYEGKSQLNGASIDVLEFNLDHNYRKDDPGEGNTAQTVKITVDGKDFELPKTLGAYYDFTEDKGNLYNALDYGLIGGVSYYLSRTLYFNVRLQYGLADLTRDEADLNANKLGPNNAPVFNTRKDRNFTVQASVGFSF